MLETILHLLNPEWILNNGGMLLVPLIVFAETGLLLGFFLPGDSLLFVTGMVLSNHNITLYGDVNVGVITSIIMIIIAGVLGNATGYFIGLKSGDLLYNKKDNFIFKQKYLQQGRDFYDKHGNSTIVMARFLPIVRTFAPIIAGIVKMPKGRFMIYNFIGCVAWVLSMVLLGYFLGMLFPWLRSKLEIIVVIIVGITTMPVVYKIFIAKKK